MPGLRRSRAAGALAALAAAVLTAGPAWAARPPIGPVQINPVGHPRLCWQAGGNGSGVTLERCDPALAGQQWSLTSNGVVMNGNGYCLEAGQAAAQAAYGVAVTFSLPPQLAPPSAAAPRAPPPPRWPSRCTPPRRAPARPAPPPGSAPRCSRSPPASPPSCWPAPCSLSPPAAALAALLPCPSHPHPMPRRPINPQL